MRDLYKFIIGLLQLVRPKQWIKNVFVLSPLLFSGYITNINSFKDSCLAAFLFCLASSAVYILNDLVDVDRDKMHPLKLKNRPIASGLVSKRSALIFLLFIYFVLTYFYISGFIYVRVIAGYIILNIVYSLWLKHKPIFDIFTIALGFVLRVYVGSVALDLLPSKWMLITTLCLSLYMASLKRLKELSYESSVRNVLTYYTASLLEKFAQLSANCAVVFYSLFVIDVKPELFLTIPLVIFGLFRYWFIVEHKNIGESPTDAIYDDIPLLLVVLCWIFICGLMLLTI